MNEQHLNDLIDQYLLGKISPADKADLERLIESDPGIAEDFIASRQAFMAIQAERNRLLREKLRKIDRETSEKPAFLPRWIKIILLLLVTSFALYGVWSCFFHPASIVYRYFEPHSAPDTGSYSPSTLHPIWTAAENAFREAHFERAITLYASLLEETDSSIVHEVQWNILLCQLALKGPTPNWKLAMQSFLETAPEPLHKKAEKLYVMLNSLFYKLLFAHLHGNFSVIKPRFI